jgi:hypothetical protein
MAQDFTPLFFNSKRKHTEEGTNSSNDKNSGFHLDSSAGKKNSQDYGNPD